jgi:hypothetical protein
LPERDGYIAGVPCWVDTSQARPRRGCGLLRRPVRLGVRGRDAGGSAGQVSDRAPPRRRRGGGVIATWESASAAARRFYGALFGWTTLDLGSGEFWTLSAYGDHLEQLTPGTRERTAELGAAGFEDVVAAINRSPAMTPTRPPIGASRSRPRTPTRRRQRRPSSAAQCSSLRSTHRTRDSRCSATRRERRSPPRRLCPRTRTSAARPPERSDA